MGVNDQGAYRPGPNKGPSRLAEWWYRNSADIILYFAVVATFSFLFGSIAYGVNKSRVDAELRHYTAEECVHTCEVTDMRVDWYDPLRGACKCTR